MGIWNEPVQSKSCHHIFCKPCVLDVPNQSDTCPVCREHVSVDGFEPLQKCNRHALRRLNKLDVLCPFHKRKPAAAADGQDSEPPLKSRRVDSGSDAAEQCPWVGSYADLNKHLATCAWCLVHCPHRCGEEMQRWELEEHEQACPMNFHECDICHKKVRPTLVAEHEKVAAERHVSILRKERQDQKKLQDLEKNLDASQSFVWEKMVDLEQKLDALQTSVLKKMEEMEERLTEKLDDPEDIDQTDVLDKLKKMDKKMDSLQAAVGPSPVNTVVWIVKDMATVRQQYLKGEELRSSYFHLSSAHKISLEFYPNGAKDSKEGHYALFACVRDRSPWDLQLALRVGKEARELTHRFTSTEDRGWRSFGKVADLPAVGDLEITLRLVSAIMLVFE